MHQYDVVNSFADRVLAGNPVAVFMGCSDLSGAVMQALAGEMHLSECTFVTDLGSGSGAGTGGAGSATVRIFTPVNELAFAGHPLLGTALALSLRSGGADLKITTAKGTFQFEVTQLESDGDLHRAHVEMEQPTAIHRPYLRAPELLAALGLRHSTLPVDLYDVGPRHVFIGLEDEAQLAALRPDIRALGDHRNIAALCFCQCGDTWRMRMFSPAYGVVEDAATGSAAGPLALHLARYRVLPYGQRVDILQGVELGRPSQMSATAVRSGGGVQLRVAGSAVRVAQGRHVV